MRIAVCDDEQRFINDLKTTLDKLYSSLDMMTDGYNSGEELLKGFKHKAYDIVFLDIEMPAMDGITLARKIRELSRDVCIVFLTGHIEYAIKGYEVNALRYLTKPADEQKIKEVIDHVLGKLESSKMLWVKTADGEQRIALSDILFIEAQNQNVVISTPENSFSVRGNISVYEEQLAQYGFFRIHRGYLISLPKVLRLGSKCVVMEDNTTLPVSRSKESKLRDMLFSYVSKEAF
jgi:DNA-binding LytR/AlgR family response regulator